MSPPTPDNDVVSVASRRNAVAILSAMAAIDAICTSRADVLVPPVLPGPCGGRATALRDGDGDALWDARVLGVGERCRGGLLVGVRVGVRVGPALGRLLLDPPLRPRVGPPVPWCWRVRVGAVFGGLGFTVLGTDGFAPLGCGAGRPLGNPPVLPPWVGT